MLKKITNTNPKKIILLSTGLIVHAPIDIAYFFIVQRFQKCHYKKNLMVTIMLQ
jgi:hypothetical protein